jgi:hypothetical protein
MDFSRMPVVVLPKINGPGAYARMIAERPDVPVIFATGHSPDIALLHKAQELRTGGATSPASYASARRATAAPANRFKWITGRIRKDF